MSLQDDLARNRKIFEILTGEAPEQAPAYRPPAKNPDVADISMPRTERNAFAAPGEDLAGNSRTRADFSPPGEDGDVYQTARTRGFSLNYGTVDLPAGFSRLPGAGSVTYPDIAPEAAYSAPQRPAPQRIDPLEPIYDRMETEARMASQLSREEEFFGF